MAPKLVAEEGVLKGLVLSLEDGNQWIIGRDPDECQLLVEDPSASRKHLMARVSPQGIIVENLSTTNPAQVNAEDLVEPRLLRHGDTVTIGNGTFRFYSETGAQVEDLPSPPSELKIDLAGATPAPEEKRDSIFKDEPDNDGDHALAEINFDLLDTGRWLLKVVAGPNNGAEFAMQPESTYIIGTDPSTCDIVFHDVSVSRQHAKMTVGKDDAIIVEDLKSRNGTVIEGKPIEGKARLTPNTIVSVGTTSFIVFDREGEQHTVISPLLPAIVKVLTQEGPNKEEEARKREEEMQALREAAERRAQESIAAKQLEVDKRHKAFGPMILMAIVAGLFVLTAIGVTSLMRTETVEMPKVDADKELTTLMTPYPSVQYNYVKATGQLLLIGHVLTTTDRDQIMYNLQSMPFVQDVKDNIIIDELIYSEANQVLGKNPNWRGVTIHSPQPGKFVMTGYLQTRKQAQLLNDWISQNFPYVDLLEKRVIVEEEVGAQINVLLQENGFRDIVAKLNNGELTLSGNITSGQRPRLDDVVERIKKINGVRGVKNFVVELSPKQAVLNITENYRVTGSSKLANGQISVILNGRILQKGDVLDGMTIQSIDPNSIHLEKDGVKYQIDYNR
jgi:type III secretion system YscD/HrpQ family protein